MNYRHVYHAGNFADVLKHATLALVIEHLKLKPAPFRIIDTHAGAGLYDLSSEEAQKTGEWRQGIGRLVDEPLPAPIAALLAPYLGVVRAENADGSLSRYPGSPLLARRLMRPSDRLVANELHPEDHARLAALFARDRQVKVMTLDAWTAVKALLPPKERRGVVLIDPPFEEPGEFGRLARALKAAQRRFATGTVLLWYPIKDERAVRDFRHALSELKLANLLVVELRVRAFRDDGGLSAAGLAIFNPPFQLDDKLGVLLSFLAERLGEGRGAGFDLERHPPSRVTTA